MVSCSCYSMNSVAVSLTPNKPLTFSRNQLHVNSSSKFSSPHYDVTFESVYVNRNLTRTQFVKSRASPSLLVIASKEKVEPLRVMISGAPASGKGTQCELIMKKYDLVHIAAGDLLRAEVASGTGNGKKAKEYMERGQLVPNEIVATMVKERLLQQDSQEKGWLLDGYPRSASQAAALSGFYPDIFILLDVRFCSLYWSLRISSLRELLGVDWILLRGKYTI